MQEMNSIEGGCIFGGNGGGGGGGGDRRLRYNHHHNQALKCPRCDSLNTKFCYYNNYNLSQPRHFCKGCRRYWTRGGVLRNVPVGGGCRKAKRTKSKASSDATVSAASAMPHPEQQQRRGRVKTNSRSSSESSSLTVTNSNVAVTNNNNDSYAGGAAEAVSAVTTRANSISVSEPEFHGNRYNLGFEPGSLEQVSDCGIFSGIGNFTSLITSSNNETMTFSFDKLLNDGQWQQQQQVEEQKMMSMVREEITGGLLDQTVQVELSNMASRSENGFGALDWQDNGDQTLFDKTYWSQSQWIDQDHPPLFLP